MTPLDDKGLDLVSRAISFAARKHAGHVRKDGRTPYIAHPCRVMLIAAQVFGVTDPEVLAEAALHDTLEDTTADRDDLVEEFGERVAEIVATLSKDKRLPEEERERRYFAALTAALIETRLCKLADVLDNLRDSVNQPAESREKTRRRAREILDAFDATIPPPWHGALERVRAELGR